MPEMGSLRIPKDSALRGLRLWPVPGFEKWLIFYVPRETILTSCVFFTVLATADTSSNG